MYRNEEYFYGDSETIMFTHVWGTSCNLKCSFCLNEGKFNLNDPLTKKYNFEITDIFANISKSTNRKLLFVEHGGELLFCDYFHELFDYKTKNIKDYRALFFTNGTAFERYKTFVEKFKDYIEPFLSFHPTVLKEDHLKEYDKCIEYNIETFGYCNISFVYYEDLDYDLFTGMFEKHLEKYKDNIKIKVFFDKDMLQKRNNEKALLISYKFMKYLDEIGYNYKRLLSDDYHKDFKAKSTFAFKKDQREGIISKYMAAIEVVNDKISYIDLFKKVHSFDNLNDLRSFIVNEINTIDHDDIDVSKKSIINQLIEIL